MRMVVLVLALQSLLIPVVGQAADIFEEAFDNANFAGRGWYGALTIPLSTNVKQSGNSAAEFQYPANNTRPESETLMRKQFASIQSIYISYYVYYGSGWQNAIASHNIRQSELYILTPADGNFGNIYHVSVTLYSILNRNLPLIVTRDENNQQASWSANAPGIPQRPLDDNAWHHIEFFAKLNSVSNGIGNADGLIELTVDGKLWMSHTNVVFRNSSDSSTQFDQLAISPYLRGGNSATTVLNFWIDTLNVGDTRLQPPPLPAPSNLRQTN